MEKLNTIKMQINRLNGVKVLDKTTFSWCLSLYIIYRDWHRTGGKLGFMMKIRE